ncbi:potassium transporter [Desulfococcaceae bacterium HSG7]|nr:potassium transporter [Desulfococcaceae bacterium HSG7]
MTKTIWIIGIGKFGWRAYRRLAEASEDTRFVLVDPLQENLQRAQGPRCTLIKSDGIIYLQENLHTTNKPDWIIPALPIHLAAEWCQVRLGVQRLRRCEIPPALDALLPNPMRGQDGNIYTSHADFKCPADCEEPDDFCTITRKPHKKSMFALLEELNIPHFHSKVIRSCQLGPGIGGYRPESLFKLLADIRQSRTPLLVSTACRCHGVVTGFDGMTADRKIKRIIPEP